MHKNSNLAVIRAIVVRNPEDWTYIPVQISVVRYEDGKHIGTYDSMVNPMRDISNVPNIPEHLNAAILSIAPTPYAIAKQVESFVEGCEIDADESSAVFLRKMLAKNMIV